MNTQTITLPILDMNSPHCATRVEKAITSLASLSSSNVDFAAHTAILTDNPSAQAVRDAVMTVREAGYGVAVDKRIFLTSGITCGGCVGSVTKILSTLPGVLSVSVDIPLKRATVETVHDVVTDDAIRDALEPTNFEFVADTPLV